MTDDHERDEREPREGVRIVGASEAGRPGPGSGPHEEPNEEAAEEAAGSPGAGRPAGERPASEGVRILGADEAQAAVEAGQVGRRKPEGEPRYGDVPPRPDPGVRPAARFPLPDRDASAHPAGATWSASGEGAAPPPARPAEEPEEPGEPGSGPVPLPHWTEPPTGEVPRILPEAEPVEDDLEEVLDEDLDAWASLSGSGPRFRAGAGDWAEGDFSGELRKDEATALGALADRRDDDQVFDEQVAARRRRGAAPATPSRGPDPARARRPGLEPEVEVRSRPAASAPAPAQDLPTRVVTGLSIAAVALLCLHFGPAATTLLVSVIVGVAAFELFDAVQRQGYRPATVLGLIGAFGLPIAAYHVGLDAFPLVTGLVVVFSLLWYLAGVVRARPVVNVAMTLLVFGYVGVLGGFAGLMLEARPGNDGVGLVLGLAICAVGYDVFGYFVGSQFGKNRLAPNVSPNKTVEGLVGGMVAAVVLGLFVSGVIDLTPWDGRLAHGLYLGLVVAIMAPLGDLCESLLKRDLGIKDLGSILPGHGGVLDRFDAILFCMPGVYYLARVLEIG
ncbi:MAG: phosphatidate cytidylyltransferase [Acidimicrobiia bacterium]|nr:phosphatidate cytidylyltransferase [Acidimicrobiia bacterium]